MYSVYRQVDGFKQFLEDFTTLEQATAFSVQEKAGDVSRAVYTVEED